jgi:hypothetical protein
MERAAYCDFLFSYLALFSSNKRGPVPLADRYLQAGIQRQRLTGDDDALIRVFPRFIEGLDAFRQTRWDDALAAFTETSSALQRAGLYGTYEHLLVLVLESEMGLWKQDIHAFAEMAPAFRKAALDSRDSALRYYAEIHDMALLFFQGRLQELRRRYQQMISELPRDPPTRQTRLADIYRWLPDLLDTDCHEARRGLERALGRRSSMGPLSYMSAGVVAGFAALAEANALRTGDPEASARRVRHWARISAKAPPLMPGMAQRALAYAADAKGRQQRALDLLRAAEEAAARDGRPLDEAVCRYQRGKRIGGGEGQALMQAAREQIADRGATELMLEEDAGLR